MIGNKSGFAEIFPHRIWENLKNDLSYHANPIVILNEKVFKTGQFAEYFCPKNKLTLVFTKITILSSTSLVLRCPWRVG